MERPQWRATALAIATAVLVGLWASDASALGLGRVTVQSALGEPLRAEIDVPEITADEQASLRATIASPDVFRAAGFEYNPAMGSIQITLQRRPDGRHFLQLSSQRPINDPFIDLILEASWSSGRVVRDYTMLFDPPNLRQSAPAVAAQVPPAAARTPAAPSAAQPSRPSVAQPAEPAARAPTSRPPAVRKPADGEGKQVTVQSGDTAGRIAAANKPTNVSLDQMLVALLQSNPEAFIKGNVNRLRAGAVLDVPTAEQVEAIPPGEARRTIVAQSRDFNDFRRRLAESLPTSPIGGSERQASGRVQAQVEEKKPAATAPDKLTLSKGAVQGKGAPDKIARERAAQDDAMRLAELNKNIAELNKLGVATGPAPSGKPGTVTSGIPTPPGIAVTAKPSSAPAAATPPVATSVAKAPASAAVPVAATPVANPASAPVTVAAASPQPSASGAAVVPAAAASTTVAAAASAPVTTAAAAPTTPAASAAPPPASAGVAAAAPAVSASKPRVAAAPPPEPETSLVDDLLENPIVPATVGGVLALLLGFGFYRAQQRKKSTQVDSSFLESRLQPDSFFGASGGQRVDTNESSSATGSSMVYSPSQLDAAGDVDPVAEADVYLAYGRDLQAEEILKEAMRITPQRVAVHTKLLEIYAKRRDAKAFEQVATETYSLTRGEGPEWDHIRELGHELDASNTLYRPGGQPAHAAAAVARGADEFGAQSTQAVPVAAAPDSAVDLDLDLDFSIGDEPLEATQAAQPAEPPEPSEPEPAAPSLHSTQKMERQAVVEPMPSLDMDFGSASAAADAPALPDIPIAAPSAAPAKPAPTADAGMIEFDLGALSLDLDAPPAAASPAAAAPAARAKVTAEIDEGPVSTAGAPLSTGGLDDSGSDEDPLATKLALAQEFNAIGDPDGARSLAEEVLAAASGDLKQKAQRFLAEIA